MNVRPSSRARRSASAKVSAPGGLSTTSAPCASAQAMRKGLAVSCMTTLADMPATRAAQAAAMAWFPALAAVIPAGARSGGMASAFDSAPRALKVPVC